MTKPGGWNQWMNQNSKWTFRPAAMCLGPALAVVPALGGCADKKTSGRDLSFVDAAKAAELVKSNKGVLGVGSKEGGAFVDARTKQEFDEGHIPGAINLPFATVWTDHKKLKGISPLVVYGDDYGDPISEGMSKRLIELGYSDVKTLRGGLRAWKAAGNDVEATSDNP